jgi:hypothetical protein
MSAQKSCRRQSINITMKYTRRWTFIHSCFALLILAQTSLANVVKIHGNVYFYELRVANNVIIEFETFFK